MGRGQLILVLIGVMIVMTLLTQNIKRFMPLMTDLAQTNGRAAQNRSPRNADLFRQLGIENPQRLEQQKLQALLDKFTPSKKEYKQILIEPERHPYPPRRPRTSTQESLFKDWMTAALVQAEQEQTAQTPTTNAAPPKAYIEIVPEEPLLIKNENFTARELRRTRMMLREMRQNNEDTAYDVRLRFGRKAAEEAKQIAQQTERKAEKAALEAKNWNEFEDAFEKIYTQGETKLKELMSKYIK